MEAGNEPTSEREMKMSFSFDRAGLRLEYSLIGVVVHLDGCATAGAPGSPALPSQTARVVLPPHTRLAEARAEASDVVLLNSEILPIAPLQPLRAAASDKQENAETPPYNRPEEEQRDYPHEIRDPRQDDAPKSERFPTPAFVPANTDLYAEATDRPVGRLLAAVDEGLNQIATIQLNPVRLNADGLLEFSPRIDVTLTLEPVGNSDDRRVPATIHSRGQAMRQIALTRLTVVNPDQVIDYSDLFPIFPIHADYLIVADNQTWNSETIAPTGSAGGDLVASFERLAAWKRQRGLKARVVTISDIVAGRYGNFRSGSRDLQEVIRRFLQMAQDAWGVAWVLLGGDTSIVPVRRVAGGREGNINLQASNPPPDNTSFWTGSYLRMHVVNPGTWWGAATTNLLVRPDTGMLIPYDATGASNSTTRGWYFTTNNTYSTRSAMPTEFVRVNGPAGQVNANLQFLYEWNTIPTDLYYSSLVGPQYNQPGRHDWDLTNNHVYGQHFAGLELDGINYTPTVSLGRAPVRNVAEADTFVAKVIAYEKYQRPDGTTLDQDWTKRVVMVSENWGGRLWIGSSSNNPPDNNSYHHSAGQGYSLIKLADTPDWNWSLLAYVAEGDVRLMPYRTDAATAGRGWHFAFSETDLSPRILLIPLPGGGLMPLPVPSQWIVVYGPPDEVAPVGYIFNNLQLDGSLADQEALRRQLQHEMAGFSRLRRLYEDIQDMTPSQVGAGPVELITTAGLRDALNDGPHIVSLSGHGSGWGCCKLDQTVADSLSNGYHTFIAYADSCLTNQFDGDAMSEHLVRNANGGAVAYVGNSRFSWIGAGDDIQRRFFHQWATLAGHAHLGLLFDTRSELVDSFYWADGRWSVLSLNLMGDPEMPLWWNQPFHFRVPEVYHFDRLRLLLDPPNPPDPPYRIDLPYSRIWGLTTVHLRQGGREQVALANPAGWSEMSLADFEPGTATLTVTRPGHQPVVQEVQIKKSPVPRADKRPWLFALVLFLLGLLAGWALRDTLGGQQKTRQIG